MNDLLITKQLLCFITLLCGYTLK